jgi:DNA adenine methylase
LIAKPELTLFESDLDEGAPFLKWAGGKTQLLPQLIPLLPKHFRRYAESFVGSAALFFQLRRSRGKFPSILMDLNDELINCFKVVRDSVDDLIPQLDKHRSNHSREHYYAIRKLSPKQMDAIDRAARLIYLNKTCYNGLYRVNSHGQFNVPIGSYAKPRIYDEPALRSASKSLRDAEIVRDDFTEIQDRVEEGDFIYFDPPYHPISKTSSFTGYTVRNFALPTRRREAPSFAVDEQQLVAAMFEKLDSKGCLVMLSNSDSPQIRQYYERYRIDVVAARRVINCDGTKRGAIDEIVVRNF